MNARPRRPLTRVSAVVFDCDSTLAAIEGIDELAADHRAAIAALTDAAMRGDLPLEAVYERRLSMIRPHRRDLDALARRYVEGLVPDARDVVAALHAEDVDVRIMSGGLRPAVAAVADALGIAPDRTGAVDISFGDDGAYLGFDTASPLARSHGKRALMTEWRREMSGAVMLVGDGATDLEAADIVDVFVAYAGVVERRDVVAAADAVVRSRSLAPVLPLALGGAPPRNHAWRNLYERGLSLLDDALRDTLLQRTDP